MGLRPAYCYSNIERAYTRKSKFKNKSYVKAVPNSKIAKFVFGDNKKKFSHQLDYVSKDDVQVRHNALESCRQVVNRHLNVRLGNNYFFQIRAYPHQVLREHKMLTGAGADRMSPGMAHAFGRPIGLAAQLKRGKVLFTVKVDEDNVETAKEALSKANPRISGHYKIEVRKLQ